jgi:hypothetical protein
LVSEAANVLDNLIISSFKPPPQIPQIWDEVLMKQMTPVFGTLQKIARPTC